MSRNYLFLLLLIVITLVMQGCWQTKYVFYDDIIAKPSDQWTHSDCRAIIETNTVYNRFDDESPVNVFATAFSPLVLTAINRMDQKALNRTESEYDASLKEDLDSWTELTLDEATEKIYDRRKKVFRSERQMDSLAFLVSFSDRNLGPGIATLSSGANINNWDLAHTVFDLKNYRFSSTDVFGYIDKVYLENEQGQLLKPNWLGAEKGGRLIGGQRMLVMFQLRQGQLQFLENSTRMVLVVRGYERDVRLPFDLLSPDSATASPDSSSTSRDSR